MYGAAGVAGLGALYGAKKLFWSQKPPPQPTADDKARMLRAEQYLADIITIYNNAKAGDAGYNEIGQQIGLLNTAINNVGLKDLSVEQMTQARANVDQAAQRAQRVLQEVQSKASPTSTGYSNLQLIVTGLGALVAVGAGGYLGYYGIAPTFATLQKVGGMMYENSMYAANVVASYGAGALRYLPFGIGGAAPVTPPNGEVRVGLGGGYRRRRLSRRIVSPSSYRRRRVAAVRRG